ncbi:MAG: hypothetical protein ACE5KW_06145 [Dehalococcoidia bacterium]
MRPFLRERLNMVRIHLGREEGQLADSPLKLILIVGTSMAWLAVIATLGASLIEPVAKYLG